MPKLIPQEHQKLIKKYNISFDGPIRPCFWPSRYSSLFHKVRDAEKIRYDEYCWNPGNDPQKVRQIAELCKLVEDIVRGAYRCRYPGINESTWRKVEHQIFHRFEAEIKCHVCDSRRWIPDLQAIPICPVAARRLQEERSQWSLCVCEERIRAKLQPMAYEESIFLTRTDSPVVDETLPEIRTKVLKRQKPDRVIGLDKTTKLKELIFAHQGLEISVRKEDDNIILPFLLLEAKSEEKSPGFDSVERQSAFPLRALIKIQQGLEQQTGVAFDPFVWFLANQGDEWRVYSCFTDRGSIRIIDLWHGSILRHDSALQLLLIMDMICDWAKEIYQKQVYRCLSGGYDFLDAQATAGLAGERSCTTDAEYPAFLRSEQDDLHAGVNPTPSPSTVNNDVPIKKECQGDTTMAGENSTPSSSTVNNDVPINESQCDTTMVDDEIPSLDFILSTPSPDDISPDDPPHPWSSDAAFRHAKCIRLRFRHFRIPDTFEGLEAIFTGQTAKMLLDLFRLHDPLVLEMKFINRVKKAWMKRTLEKYEYENDDMSETKMFAVLAFRTFLDYAEWDIIKELSFITASCAAINNLVAFVAGKTRPSPFLREEHMRTPWILPRIIHPLRYLPIPELTKAAAMDLCLHFQVKRGVAAPICWILDRTMATNLHHIWSAINVIWKPLAYACLGVYLYRSIRSTIGIQEIPCNSAFPLPFLKVPDFYKRGSMAWVKKPDSVATEGPKYCLFFFDMASITDYVDVGWRIIDLLSQSAMPWYSPSGPQLIHQHDRAILTYWADIFTSKR